MKLDQLVNMDRLSECIENGLIGARTYHGKTIYNYTPKVTYSGYWTPETTILRGVICDEDNNVIARPFAKFFTLDQEQGSYHLCDEEGSFESTFVPDFNARIVATDKLDGSLGILWNDNGEPALSTRGRLDSEIAIYFTLLLRSNDKMYKCAKHMIERSPHMTFLFELLDPKMHVIHYKAEDIVFLGSVDIETGNWIEACLLDSEWEYEGLSIAQRLDCHTLAEALELPERENAEGMVIHFEDGKLIKFKQESYLTARKFYYNWKKAFAAELKETNFAQWTDYYLNGRTLDESFNFSNEVFANKELIYSTLQQYHLEVICMIYLWRTIVLPSFEELTQKEYALKILAEYPEYKKFLFAARKYHEIDNLRPFDYIEEI